jgi:hypothetical protein
MIVASAPSCSTENHPVEIRDMTGAVRVTAAHARATILETTGQVDASAFVIDFAGSRGRVDLSAEAEINPKMTAPRFEGTIMAWAQRPVRMLVPPGFMTPFQALVNHPQDFICAARPSRPSVHKFRSRLTAELRTRTRSSVAY